MDENSAPVAAPAQADAAAPPSDSLLTSASPAVAAPPAPLTYELQAPEGVDPSMLDGVKDFLAQNRVPPELAQPLFDKYLGAMRDVNEANAAAWSDMQAQWKSQVAADPEIGGNRTNGVISSIRKGAETLLGSKGAAAFYGALDMTGAGNHPEIIRALNRGFSIHAPPTHVAGRPEGSAKDNRARAALNAIYPSQSREDQS